MQNCKSLLPIYPESFCATVYSTTYFRMIGLVDVNMAFSYGTEKVTLAYYRSSGTNNGKIEGLWYPIVGIKLSSGAFLEFGDYLNFVLTQTTQHHGAKKGWLAKSLFFSPLTPTNHIQGFSHGIHYEDLLALGNLLRDLYEQGNYFKADFLNPYVISSVLISSKIYPNNLRPQRENFEKFIQDIYTGV